MLFYIGVVVFAGYFLGSIPWGLLAGGLKGIDIRQFGSGNIGATNALRVLGKPVGILVFVLDAAKGWAAVRLALAIAGRTSGLEQYSELLAIAAAAACVVGHSFPLWLGFKGGKGVATSSGALLGIVPIAVVTMLAVWIVVFKVTRYVSLSSVVAALTLPLAVSVLVRLGMTQGYVLIYFSAAMTALVIWRHRGNLSRLISGTEPRFTRK